MRYDPCYFWAEAVKSPCAILSFHSYSSEAAKKALLPDVFDKRLEPLSASSLGDYVEWTPCQPMLTIKIK